MSQCSVFSIRFWTHRVRRVCPHTRPYLHICSAVPLSASGVWQQVHQQFQCTFFNGKEEVWDFSGVRGWPFLFRWRILPERWAGAQQTDEKSQRRGQSAKSTAPGGTAPPRDGRAVRNHTVSPSSSAVTSSGVSGQTGNGQLSPLAPPPLRVGGVLVGAGGGGTPRKEKTTRREEGAGSLRRFQPEGAGGLATAPRTS